jgi:DNA invertase Pin-like site-specific DNA recombinase
MTDFGYCRVSTVDQNPDLQLDALVAAGIDRRNIFVDHVSGTRDSRPGLDGALEAVRAGDRLTVWKLDRLGRSMSHLVRTVEDLASRGVQFRSLRDPIDTSTANGRLMFGIFAAVAQFEREITLERTMAGLASARARGVAMGRPSKVHPEQVHLIRRLAAEGLPHRKVAVMTGVSRSAVGRVLRDEIGSLRAES